MKRIRILLTVIALVAVTVCVAALCGVKHEVFSTRRCTWVGLRKGKQAIAVFSDQPGTFSVGYYRSIKGVDYPSALSVDRHGVYYQSGNRRGRPKITSFRWSKP